MPIRLGALGANRTSYDDSDIIDFFGLMDADCGPVWVSLCGTVSVPFFVTWSVKPASISNAA